MKQSDFSYESFLDSIQQSTVPVLQESTEKIIKHFQPATRIPAWFAGTTFLLDYSTKKYLYIQETCFNVLGYTAQWFLETGVEEYLSNWHKDDFNIINRKIFPDNRIFLKTLPLTDYDNYVFSYNYRMKNPNGKYLTILQRFSYVPGPIPGDPAGVIGIAFDITHFKNDLSIVHTIKKVVTTKEGTVNELIFKKIHPLYDGQRAQVLSKKETEILQLVAKGLSSKQIASKMELSINTVNNHRKNMLGKLQCTSSSELMNYAAKHGLV